MAITIQDLRNSISYYTSKQEEILARPIDLFGTVEDIGLAFIVAYQAKFEIEMFRRMTLIVNDLIPLDEGERSKTAAEAVRDCMMFLIEFQTRTPLTAIGDLLDDFAEIAIGNIPPIIAMLQDVPV